MTRTRLSSLATGLAGLAAAGAAMAHPGHPGHESLGAWAGLAHPWSGLDHLLAMTAVGLWATLRGGRALVAWPATFLCAMALGFSADVPGGALIEAGVLASVVVLGLLTATDRLGEPAALGLVAGAGVLHGAAHAADVGQAGPLFELGMLASTAALHAIGVGAGAALQRAGRPGAVRIAGVAVAAGGVLLAVAG